MYKRQGEKIAKKASSYITESVIWSGYDNCHWKYGVTTWWSTEHESLEEDWGDIYRMSTVMATIMMILHKFSFLIFYYCKRVLLYILYYENKTCINISWPLMKKCIRVKSCLNKYFLSNSLLFRSKQTNRRQKAIINVKQNINTFKLENKFINDINFFRWTKRKK